jgi:hypothetical protein
MTVNNACTGSFPLSDVSLTSFISSNSGNSNFYYATTPLACSSDSSVVPAYSISATPALDPTIFSDVSASYDLQWVIMKFSAPAIYTITITGALPSPHTSI